MPRSFLVKSKRPGSHSSHSVYYHTQHSDRPVGAVIPATPGSCSSEALERNPKLASAPGYPAAHSHWIPMETSPSASSQTENWVLRRTAEHAAESERAPVSPSVWSPALGGAISSHREQELERLVQVLLSHRLQDNSSTQLCECPLCEKVRPSLTTLHNTTQHYTTPALNSTQLQHSTV
ncbi:hypothetical protein Baya_14047 [Bagarius yarrelli]|uniref:Uncharacterized protein n=1 Tax=Bagarius yarrelli TaxID=175774 RepID=A0A556V7U5_BAGYA|nr:hypothetical protein Baya_14047 [Bagarius yarrelli]